MINTSQSLASNIYYNRERPSITSRIKMGPNAILDLGCGTGALGRILVAAGKAREMIGVEIFEAAAAEAALSYSVVHQGDIECMDLPYSGRFDYVVCGDVLEHLKDPYTIVKKIAVWLKPGGHLIASVPNIRCWTVLFDLALRGRWEYQDSGIMDRTHLRFFTRSSFFAMLKGGGFDIVNHEMLISKRRFIYLNRATLGLFDGLLGSQVVVLACKAPEMK